MKEDPDIVTLIIQLWEKFKGLAKKIMIYSSVPHTSVQEESRDKKPSCAEPEELQ